MLPLPDIILSTRINEIPARDLQDIEDKFENFVFLVIRKALEKYESYKKEGSVKRSKKPPKGTSPVEVVGAVAGAAVGASFGLFGMGVSVGATISKIGYEFTYGYFHRQRAKTIVRGIEKSCTDETQIISMFASIGAEIFRVFEYQLASLAESDLQKVANDVVIGVYNAIAAKPNIWDKDECERSALLAKSAMESKGFLDEVSRGHNVNSIESWKSKDLLSKTGLYDGENYFVSDNTYSQKYRFRRPFKNEVIDRKSWRLANIGQIGSFQPHYFVTDDMTTRVKENAISKTIAANPTMAVYSADARGAFTEYLSWAHELRAEVSHICEQLAIEKAQADRLVGNNQEVDSSLTKVGVEPYAKQSNSTNIEERLNTVYVKEVKNRELAQNRVHKREDLEENLACIAGYLHRKCKIDTVLKADEPDLWDKDECERSVLLARSASEPGAILDEISDGHNANSIEKAGISKTGIHDNRNHFVSDHADSMECKFRPPFKNDVIDEKVWRLAKDGLIGSFQPQYLVTDDMTTRVKENAISKTIAADPTLAAKQNAVYSADARTALKEGRALAQELHAKTSNASEQLEIDKAQADLLVAKNQEVNSSLTKYEVEAYTKLAKSANLRERLKTVAEKDEKHRELVQTVASKYKDINASLTRIAEDQQRKCKIDIALKADEPDLSYVQRNEPYGKLKEFYGNHLRDTLGSARFTVIVGEKGVGKSDLARSFANNEFKDKHVLWIEATNEKTLKAAFIVIAKEMEIGGIVENKDSKDIQKEIYSRLDPDQAIVVFDDVDKFENIEPFMPREVLLGERSPFVLITSKNDKHWKEGEFYYDCDIIELGPFDDSECLQFFKDSLQDGGYDVMEMDDTDEAIIELGRELNSIPAELVAAVNNIFYKKCTLTHYLNAIRNTQ